MDPIDPGVLDAFVEDEDPFQLLLDDRNSSPQIEETLAAALLRLNDPKNEDFQYDPLKAFDDLPRTSSTSTYPLTYDCRDDNCHFDTACTLPDCTLDPRTLQPICCDDTCADALTVTCNEPDCASPGRCDRVCGTCNNTSCEAEPCADANCPVAFPHYDLCFEAACAPSPGSGQECEEAPCELGECGGTFVINTCKEGHQGWDPNCPGSLVSPQDIVHDYEGMPPPSSLFGTGFFQPQAQYQQWPSAVHGGQQFSTMVDFGAYASTSSQNQSTPSLSPATSVATLYDQTQWPSPVASRSAQATRKRRADCCQPLKRQRISSQTPDSMSTVSMKSCTSAPLDAHASDVKTEFVCQWITNPHESAEGRQTCGFISSSPKDLHDHLVKEHTSTLNSHTRFHCHWSDCPRLLTADYGQKSKLNRHLLTHSAYLPYPCSQVGCSKSFSTNDQRRNHEATHTDERKYCCDWPGCGAKFRHATSLSTHKYTHTGEKPYVCWICGHREGDPSNKSKHMKREHPDLPRQRPANWDEEKTRRELESRGYSWPVGVCKMGDGCDR